MKIWISVVVLWMGWMTVLCAAPTESRIWKAANGKSVEGRVLSIQGDKVVLERADGKTVNVSLSVFVEEDVEFLRKHFKIEAPKPGDPQRSVAAPAEGLAFPAGKVSGPISAGQGSSYFVYIPKSLKKGRKAPLMFYTNAQPGGAGVAGSLAEGAEVGGWIVGASVESNNNNDFPVNVRISEAAVGHIVSSLPVDPKRIYFTGNSGGAATAMANASKMNAAGAMPNVGYIPQGYNPPKGDYFVLSGGTDFNRYNSASIGRKFGKDAVHRMNDKGHGGMDPWMRIDGMNWLNLRFLKANKSRNADEAMDFEANLIEWMRSKKASEPYRVYSTARLLKDDYGISGKNQVIVDQLIAELGADGKNRLYHEGLAAIDQISKETMADFGGSSLYGHTSEKTVKAAQKELPRFAGVPVIEATLKAMASPTEKK